MRQLLVYGDSLSWGIVPDTRRRLPFALGHALVPVVTALL